MSQLERVIINMVWDDVKVLPIYDSWRTYERGFTYENQNYTYKCKFLIESGHLRLKDALIAHERKVIDLM